MSVIEVNPQQLATAAVRLHDSTAKLRDAATALSASGLPEMPAATAAAVEAAMNRARSDFQNQANQFEQAAHDLAARVVWAILAGYGLLRLPGISAGRLLFGLFSGSVKLGEQRSLWQMLRAWSFYKSEVQPFELAGRTGSPEALRAWFLWQQEISHSIPPSRFAAILAGEGDVAQYLRVVAGPLRGLRGVVGKATPFLGIVTNLDTIIGGSSLPGWRGTVDRGIMAPLGLGGSGVAAASALGLIELTPPGEVATAVVLLGAGAWALGNLAYDHRKQIAHAVVGGAKFVERHPLLIAPIAPPVAGGLEIWNHRRDIAHGIVKGYDFARDQVEAMPGRLESAGNTVVHGIEDAPSAIGSLFSGL